MFAASEIYTALKSYMGNVTVKIVGMAASAASVYWLAKKRDTRANDDPQRNHVCRGRLPGHGTHGRHP